MKKIKYSLISAIYFFGNYVLASSALNFRIHHEYESPRALGMGDAFVALANDYSAIFYNPAALARRDDGQINLYIGGSAAVDFFTFGQKISEAADTNGSEAQKKSKVLSVLDDSYGDNYFVKLTMPNGIWARPNWSVAVIPFTETLNMSIHKGFGPTLNVTSYTDTIMAYALAKDFYWFESGRTSLGVTFKSIYRGYMNSSLSVVDSISSPSTIVNPDFLSEGITFDADIGGLYTPEIPTEGFWSLLRLARPTFGAVVRNVFDYGFTNNLHVYNKTNTTSKPERLYRRIDLGTRWEYPEFLIFGGRGVMDFRDILHPNVNFKKSLHLGFEFDWTMFTWWRGHYRFGVSQGYLTAGASALFSFFNLDLVTYSEDVGSRNESVESRKFEIRMNIDI